MKYIVIEEHPCQEFVHEFDTKEEAIKFADSEFNRLCEADKKRITAYYVLESANPDEDAEDHFDGNPIKEYI